MAGRRRITSPDVEVDLEGPEELEAVSEIISREEHLEEALEYAKEHLDKPIGLLEKDLQKLIDRGEIWYTVIPEKVEEE